MLESYATLTATIPAADRAKWHALITGLANNQHGAYLEEYAEAFGAAAEQAVEALLDEWEEYRGEMDTRGSTLKGDTVVVQLAGYRGVEASLPEFIAFLKACGASNVQQRTDLVSDRG